PRKLGAGLPERDDRLAVLDPEVRERLPELRLQLLLGEAHLLRRQPQLLALQRQPLVREAELLLLGADLVAVLVEPDPRELMRQLRVRALQREVAELLVEGVGGVLRRQPLLRGEPRATRGGAVLD